MTNARLRDLMDERVADVEGRDLAAPAWARADVVRRRRRYAVMVTAAAAVLVVAGTVSVLDDGDESGAPATGRPSTTATSSGLPADVEAPRATPAGPYKGASFWWAPSGAQDAMLPALQVPGIPEVLSMADQTLVSTPPDHVDAVFATGKQQYKLLTDERLVSVDLSDRLGPVADEGGNEYSPLGHSSLSPDGTRVAFRQPGRIEVWDLPTNTWSTVESPDAESVAWTLDGELWLPGDGETGRPDPWQEGDHQFGPVVTGPDGLATELDWMAHTDAPTTGDPDQVLNPELLVAGRPDDLHILALTGPGRSKLCCSVIGWFSHDFVVFEASSAQGRVVLAWRVGTPDLYRVSGFSDFPRSVGWASSWAEHGSFSAEAP